MSDRSWCPDWVGRISNKPVKAQTGGPAAVFRTGLLQAKGPRAQRQSPYFAKTVNLCATFCQD